jgi:hypothetical protein
MPHEDIFKECGFMNEDFDYIGCDVEKETRGYVGKQPSSVNEIN